MKQERRESRMEDKMRCEAIALLSSLFHQHG